MVMMTVMMKTAKDNYGHDEKQQLQQRRKAVIAMMSMVITTWDTMTFFCCLSKSPGP